MDCVINLLARRNRNILQFTDTISSVDNYTNKIRVNYENINNRTLSVAPEYALTPFLLFRSLCKYIFSECFWLNKWCSFLHLDKNRNISIDTVISFLYVFKTQSQKKSHKIRRKNVFIFLLLLILYRIMGNI